ncbi:MAG TPA: hypothetical protein ENH95_06000, partial [Nitrosopumilus sp.]|nr:hypothetical protein [Nitrosopumilus sp.]
KGTLGELNYVACRRDKVVLVSFPFPISKHLLLVSAEPNVSIEESCDTGCKTAKAVFIRSASLLSNSKKIKLGPKASS